MTTLVLVLLVLLAVAAVASSNRFVRQRHLVEESQHQVDVELRRRHDLVPGLVAVVRACAAHESAALDRVLEARETARRDPAAEAQLGAELRGLVRRAEGYPALTSTPAFQQLQAQLAETEDRLAAARRLHAGNVRALNTRIDTFPSSLVASVRGVERAEPPALEPAERDALELPPDLDLDPPAGRALP